jgi:hypothetical protein
VTINISTEPQSETISPSPMPTEIRWALGLLWLSFAITLVWSLYGLYGTYTSYKSGALTTALEVLGTGSFFMMSANPFVALACHGYLNICIVHRKNWARIAKLLLVVGLIIYPIVNMLYLSYQLQKAGVTLPPPPPIKLTAFQYFMNGIVPALTWAGVYLLFLSPGRFWFRRVPSSTDV